MSSFRGVYAPGLVGCDIVAAAGKTFSAAAFAQLPTTSSSTMAHNTKLRIIPLIFIIIIENAFGRGPPAQFGVIPDLRRSLGVSPLWYRLNDALRSDGWNDSRELAIGSIEQGSKLRLGAFPSSVHH
jgi:hypothetical protein